MNAIRHRVQRRVVSATAWGCYGSKRLGRLQQKLGRDTRRLLQTPDYIQGKRTFASADRTANIAFNDEGISCPAGIN
jgi:hypothetical protein